jgi:hypothetical protein
VTTPSRAGCFISFLITWSTTGDFYYALIVQVDPSAAGSSAGRNLPRAYYRPVRRDRNPSKPAEARRLLPSLADAMKADPYLWVVLVMREDYIAALDPYSHLLPGQLRARYYMRRMGVASALDAIRKPVERIRAFEPGVAELLVDNMRLITGSKISGQNDQPVYGEFVEPVQLQVVCFQLWEGIQPRGSTTKRKHITG